MQDYRMINQILPQPEAAVLNGILLGLDNDLPASLTTAYQRTGTAHIIAISGIIALKWPMAFYVIAFFEKNGYTIK